MKKNKPLKLSINGIHYTVEEHSQKEIKEEQNKRAAKNIEEVDSVIDRYYGITFHDNETIWIDEALPFERKRRVLMHELTHCYINEFVTHQPKQYDEEFVADIVANTHDMISLAIQLFEENQE